MNTIEAIMTRRSIRSWTNEPVAEADQKKILEAAMNAPSAADARPWHFVAMDDRAVIDQFTTLGGTEMLSEATFAVLVCAEIGKEIYPGFWPQDCSCAAQNMQLAAQKIMTGALEKQTNISNPFSFKNDDYIIEHYSSIFDLFSILKGGFSGSCLLKTTNME